MIKILKDIKEYNNNKHRYERFKSDQLGFIEYESDKKEFELYKNEIANFKNQEDDYKAFLESKDEFEQYQLQKEQFDKFLNIKDDFQKYSNIISSNNGTYFLMYASNIDNQGNIEFNYDFSETFINTLKQHGMHGIDDVEILENYLHFIFSQNYFASMLTKDDTIDQKDKA